MAYSDKVVDHYNNPRNVGSLPKEDPNVGTGLVGAPECGDVMKLQMRQPRRCDRNPLWAVVRLTDRRLVLGPPRVGEGKDRRRGASIKNLDIIRELALPPVKLNVLAENAIKRPPSATGKQEGHRAVVAERPALKSRGAHAHRE
jgi:nitrogen fixation NifU-like protein